MSTLFLDGYFVSATATKLKHYIRILLKSICWVSFLYWMRMRKFSVYNINNKALRSTNEFTNRGMKSWIHLNVLQINCYSHVSWWKQNMQFVAVMYRKESSSVRFAQCCWQQQHILLFEICEFGRLKFLIHLLNSAVFCLELEIFKNRPRKSIILSVFAPIGVLNTIHTIYRAIHTE